MKQVQYNISEMERAFECGRNFQLTGENNFTELIKDLNGEIQFTPNDAKQMYNSLMDFLKWYAITGQYIEDKRLKEVNDTIYKTIQGKINS